MKIVEAKNGLYIIEPIIYSDNRGYFFESYSERKFNQLYKKRQIKFIQDNESLSKQGVLRGLHYQVEPYSQSKLVRVIDGEILDIVVDIRTQSPTFGNYFSYKLSSRNKKQLFIPEGFAHGFLTLSKIAIVNYKVDKPYSPKHEETIIWNDPYLNIEWGVSIDDIQISPKDSRGILFKDAKHFKKKY